MKKEYNGYYAQPIDCHYTSGRWRKGQPNPDRANFAKGNWLGYPNKEAYLAAKETRERKKMEEDVKAKRRAEIAKEAQNIQDLAREFSEQALQAIAEIMNSENETGNTKLAAAMALLDRAHGKPVASIVNTNLNAEVKPSEVNAADLDTRIAEALNRVEKFTGREAKAAEGKERPTDLRKYN